MFCEKPQIESGLDAADEMSEVSLSLKALGEMAGALGGGDSFPDASLEFLSMMLIRCARSVDVATEAMRRDGAA